MHREEGYLHGRELDKAEGDNGGEESDRRNEIQGTGFLANGIIACTWVRQKRTRRVLCVFTLEEVEFSTCGIYLYSRTGMSSASWEVRANAGL